MNLKKHWRAILPTFVLLVTSNTNSFAGDAAAGKAKSISCAACHGMAGISANPM